MRGVSYLLGGGLAEGIGGSGLLLPLGDLLVDLLQQGVLPQVVANETRKALPEVHPDAALLRHRRDVVQLLLELRGQVDLHALQKPDWF